MEVAPAGQFENDLHLTADRLPYQHFITQFLWVGCSSCRPTNSVKALKALELKACLNQLKIEMTRRAISISVGFPSLSLQIFADFRILFWHFCEPFRCSAECWTWH